MQKNSPSILGAAFLSIVCDADEQHVGCLDQKPHVGIWLLKVWHHNDAERRLRESRLAVDY